LTLADMSELPPTPDLTKPHTAISLHFKRFDEYPGMYWHQDEKRWYERDDFDTLIALYEDRVQGWFLDCVRQVQHNGGFIMLMVAVSYVEGADRYRTGDTDEGSGHRFRRSMRRIFDVDDSTASVVWKHVRCALFHDGMTGKQILLDGDLEQSISSGEGGEIRINAQRFLDRILGDLQQYVAELRDLGNTALREKFKEVFLHDRERRR
jgi:hypothetical protein